jgi:hypothetical protein
MFSEFFLGLVFNSRSTRSAVRTISTGWADVDTTMVPVMDGCIAQ